MRDSAASRTQSAGGRAAGPANRLSIGLLLLWTSTTAAVIAFLQAVMPLREFPGGDWSFVVSLLCFSPAYGAAIAGVALGVWRGIRRKSSFPAQPGHWLLIVLGTVTLGIPLVGKLGASMNRWVWELGPFALFILVALLVGAAAWQSRQRHWGWAWLLSMVGLVLLAIAFALVFALVVPGRTYSRGLITLSIVLTFAGLVVPPLAILVATGVDLATREQRDILHWAGVFTLIAVIAQPVAMLLIEALLIG